MEGVYDKHSVRLTPSVPRIPRIVFNNDDRVLPTTFSTRLKFTSTITTAVTSDGHLKTFKVTTPNMLGTRHLSSLRTSSTRTFTVALTPIRTPFTVIGLQYWFVQDTL